ncbi:MAG: plasmid pRiA4b ORF-3 family protein [Leptolyngbyaceae cyanobacterium SM1_1_3]|nr:plasmid pRiA4b ORF-3 family protein [Leptolyngbyaceae cyanobacterium SM1_1_3]NJN02978.1 plasmid pRiA4b ORF-3 family protein [Leptolyngbyaceae cyanobacterium RM1_1_2]NJO10748.1 plasmid pRiA4b ORF-3 family protein [Leptolyngbyaceae cyanobacterium SL_1_1]
MQAQVYQLVITLADSDPAVWRRCQVPIDISLVRLHIVLQAAMGWQNSHQYEFKIGGDRYGASAAEGAAKDEQGIHLSELAVQAEQQFTYFYDFGDGWLHLVLLEAVLPLDPQQTYPVCLGGEQACPPEDSGGIWGYEELLERLNDPEEPDYLELWNWVGSDFNPDVFDLEAANQRLRAA